MTSSLACISVRADSMATSSSVIGRDTRVTGNLSGEGSLHIEGSVTGNLSVAGAASIGEGGNLEGDVQAESLDVTGTMIGNVETSGPISIRSGAEVRGDLKGSQVAIEPGSRVSVRLDTEFEIESQKGR